MKAIEALELGKACGLDDVRSAMENISIHSANLFTYGAIVCEIGELAVDFCRLWDLGGSLDMPIVDAIELMNS